MHPNREHLLGTCPSLDSRPEICSFIDVIEFKKECSDLPLQQYAEGDLVISEGGRSGALYFLKSGKVRISRGGEVLAEIDEAGSLFGEISILLDRPHIAEVRALEPSSFHVAEDAEAFLKQHPEVNLLVARSLAKKVDTMSCYLIDLKRQYAGDTGHMGMVHEVLDSLMHSR